jgi:hypothetical protein
MLVLYDHLIILSIRPKPINIFVVQNKEVTMSSLRSLSINLEVGQEIAVGPNDELAKITKIEFHEKSGEVTINTTRGPRKALTFKLAPTYAEDWINPADKYR